MIGNVSKAKKNKKTLSHYLGGVNKSKQILHYIINYKKMAEADAVLKKEFLNIVFCGHIDAGKSTIGGQLM